MSELLDTYYLDLDYKDHYQFLTVNRVINALEAKGINVPIETNLVENKVQLSFDENKDIDIWKKNHNIHGEASPKEALLNLIDNDKI